MKLLKDSFLGGWEELTTAIFGAKNTAQVEENVAASDFTLSQEDIEFLNMGV